MHFGAVAKPPLHKPPLVSAWLIARDMLRGTPAASTTQRRVPVGELRLRSSATQRQYEFI